MISRATARQWALVRTTIFTLVGLALSLLLTIGAASMIASAAHEIRQPVWSMLGVAVGLGDPDLRDAWSSGDGLVLLVFGLLMAGVAGAAMFILLPRGRRLWLVPALLLVAGVLVLVPAGVELIERLMDQGASTRDVLSRTQIIRRHREESRILTGLLVAAAAMPLGIVPATAMSRSRGRLANFRFRRRRRRLRAWRQRA